MEEDFNNWFEEYHAAIFRFCHIQVRDRALASDITQETFVRLWKYTTEKKSLEYPQALLYRIARNLIIDHSRKKSSQSLDSIIEQIGTIADHKDSERRVHLEKLDLVLLHLGELDDNYRNIIIMRYIDDMSVKDIAKSLETTPNSISVRLHRGIAKLRKIIKSVT